MSEADLKLWHAWRRHGQRDAFDALVRPHLGFVADFARRLGLSEADADDVTQQVLAGLAAERSDRPATVGLRPWLGRALVLKAKMFRRASVRRAQHESRARRGAPAADAVADRDEIDAYLAELPDPQREAVVLRYLHDMEYEEMAFMTGASVNACRLRVHKGITRLRARFGHRVGALIATLPLLAGRSEAALVKGALAKGAVSVTATAGVLAMKKAAIGIVVLACVAGSFYMLGRNDRAAPVERTAAAPRKEPPPAEPKRKMQPEPQEQPPKPEARKPDPASLEILRSALGRNGAALVAFAPRADYLGPARVKWYSLAKQVPPGTPTGFELMGPKSMEAMPLVTGAPAVYVLKLRECAFTDEHLEKIAHLRMMLVLGLSRTKVTDAGLQHLLGMTDLRALFLDETAITDDGLKVIGQLRSLRYLGLQNTQITDAGLQHLKGLVNLESIRFRAPGTTEKAIDTIAELPNINHLFLADVRVSDGTLERIARMPRLRKLRLEHFGSLKGLSGARSLEDLNLSDAKLKSDDLVYLRGLTGLKRLDLAETDVEADGLEHLAGLTNLEVLNLEEVELDDESLVHLAGLTKLENLRLDAAGITDKGVKHLAGLTNLESLQIDENPVTDACIEHLIGLRKLRYLDLKETRITAAGLARLRKALPGCRIREP